MRIFDKIGSFLNQKSTVQMVSDDPQMAAELLLLIRTMFADGEMSTEEVETFNSICGAVFGIPHGDVRDVIRYLKEVSYETSSEQAALLFAEMPDQRKRALLSHLMLIAMADARFHERERAIIHKVGALLGYSPEHMQTLI